MVAALMIEFREHVADEHQPQARAPVPISVSHHLDLETVIERAANPSTSLWASPVSTSITTKLQPQTSAIQAFGHGVHHVMIVFGSQLAATCQFRMREILSGRMELFASRGQHIATRFQASALPPLRRRDQRRRSLRIRQSVPAKRSLI